MNSKLLQFAKSLYERQLSDELQLIRSPSGMNKIYLSSNHDQSNATPSPLPIRSDNIRSQNGSANHSNAGKMRPKSRHRSLASSKVRRLRNGFMPMLFRDAEISYSPKFNSRCGGGRGERTGPRGQKGFCSTISPILSRGSDSFDSDSEQAATCSWKEDNNNTSDPEFKVSRIHSQFSASFDQLIITFNLARYIY